MTYYRTTAGDDALCADSVTVLRRGAGAGGWLRQSGSSLRLADKLARRGVVGPIRFSAGYHSRDAPPRRHDSIIALSSTAFRHVYQRRSHST